MRLATQNRRPVPLSVLLGERIRWQREARKLRQDDVAALARSWGYDWTQATVAALEAGRRQCSVEEFLLLGWIVAGQGPEAAARGDGRPIELADLFPASIGDRVMLNRRFEADSQSLRMILSGRAREGGLDPRLTTTPDAIDAERALIRRFMPPGTVGPADRVIEPGIRFIGAVDADKLGDAEGKAARRLRTVPAVIAAAARQRWGRSLTEERDRRLAEATASGGSPQARRGHITRGLLDELRQDGVEGVKPKRTSKQRQKAIATDWRRAIKRARSHP